MMAMKKMINTMRMDGMFAAVEGEASRLATGLDRTRGVLERFSHGSLPQTFGLPRLAMPCRVLRAT